MATAYGCHATRKILRTECNQENNTKLKNSLCDQACEHPTDAKRRKPYGREEPNTPSDTSHTSIATMQSAF